MGTLHSRIRELEDVVTARQAEITKVREKAKGMLKELNQDKAQLELQLQTTIADLKKQLATAEDNLSTQQKAAKTVRGD